MSDKKPSTNDILASIRGGSGGQAKSESTAEENTGSEAAASGSSEKPAAQPTGTADIMASIKSGGGGGGAAKPAQPSGTADIMASIKSGGGGGAKSDAPKAAPKGTSDILSAIRGGGAAAPSSKPAAGAKSPQKAAPVDTAEAKGMSAAEMIAAARKGLPPVEEADAKPKVALPKKPLAKPAAPKPKKGETPRRSFLAAICSPVVIAWTSLVAATTASSLAVARFMMPNVLVEPPTRFKIGPPTDYGAGTVSTKWKAQFGVWIVNDEIDGQQMIYALSTVCTHLGCTPNWLEGEQKFKCPCHGSGFYRTGVNFEGPAPRPLERHGIRLAEDGMLEVDKSVKFQQELGQWESSSSFVPV